MNILKYLFLFLVLLILTGGKTFSQYEVFEDGEELYYEVNYSFINIGWIKFNTERVSGKSNVYKCTAKMKSNDALPFVDVDYEFISEMEIKDLNVTPRKFTAYEYQKGKKSTLTYVFNYDSEFVSIKKIGFDGNIEADKIVKSTTKFQDGLSIFYYARVNSGLSEPRNVPVLMHVDTALMKINFNNQKTNVEIGEIDYDINSVRLDGFSYFTAVFGLTGKFCGWFSNDNAKMPLKAKLQVKIGNVTVELSQWKRKNWT